MDEDHTEKELTVLKVSKCIEKKLNLGLCDYKMHAFIAVLLNKKL